MLPPIIESRLRKLMEEVRNNDFDQKTIEVLLMNVRDFIEEGSLLREVGNFIAHPIRDRGIIIEEAKYQRDKIRHMLSIISGEALEKFKRGKISDYTYRMISKYYKDIKPDKNMYRKVRRIFEKSGDEYEINADLSGYTLERIKEPMTKTGEIDPEPLLTKEYIIMEMKKLLERVGLDEYNNDIDDKSKEISICIMCIMHGSKMEVDDETNPYICLGYNKESPKVGSSYSEYGLEIEIMVTDEERGLKVAVPTLISDIDTGKYVKFEIDRETDKFIPIGETDYSITAERDIQNNLYIDAQKIEVRSNEEIEIQ